MGISVGEFNIPAQQIAQWHMVFTSTDQDRDGVLSTLEMQTLLAKSGLPASVLEQIWKLSDAEMNGRFTWPKFSLAMALTMHRIGGGSVPASRTPSVLQLQSVLETRPPQSTATAASTGGIWTITQATKDKYTSIFAALDTNRDGLITPAEAYEIFKKSQLSQADLENIVQLSHRSPNPNISCRDFVVAMFLINIRMTMPSVALPTVLPQELLDCAAGPILTSAPSPSLPSSTLATSSSSSLPGIPGAHPQLGALTTSSSSALPGLPLAPTLTTSSSSALPGLQQGRSPLNAGLGSGAGLQQHQLEEELRMQSSKLDVELQSLNQQVSTASELLKDTQTAMQQLTDLCQEKESLKAATMKQWQRIQTETKELAERLEAESTRAEKLSLEIKELEQSLHSSQNDQQKMQHDLDQMQEKVQARSAEKKRLLEQQAAKNDQLSSEQKAINELLSQEKKYVRSLAKAQSKTARLDGQLTELGIEKSGVSERIALLKQQLATQRTKNKEKQKAINAQQAEIQALNANAVDLSKHLEEEVAAAPATPTAAAVPEVKPVSPQISRTPALTAPKKSLPAAYVSSKTSTTTASASSLPAETALVSSSPPSGLTASTSPTPILSSSTPNASPSSAAKKVTPSSRTIRPFGTDSDDPSSFVSDDPFSLSNRFLASSVEAKQFFDVETPHQQVDSNLFQTPFGDPNFATSFDFSSNVFSNAEAEPFDFSSPFSNSALQ